MGDFCNLRKGKPICDSFSIALKKIYLINSGRISREYRCTPPSFESYCPGVKEEKKTQPSIDISRMKNCQYVCYKSREIFAALVGEIVDCCLAN